LSFSYDNTDLDSSTASGRLNIVRLLVGDTNTSDQQVANEEITFALSESNDKVYAAAAWIADTISSMYARKVDIEHDGVLSASYSDLSKQYSALATDLGKRAKTAGSAVGVAGGGISINTIEANRANTDRVQGAFRRDRFKNPPGYTTEDYE